MLKVCSMMKTSLSEKLRLMGPWGSHWLSEDGFGTYSPQGFPLSLIKITLDLHIDSSTLGRSMDLT
jgi:hypothetical protein